MLSDMVPTGFHGVELAGVEFGDKVCVVGIGPVGLMAVAAAALRGASYIDAVGTRPNCVEAAKKYGATDIISYRDGDIAEQILEKTSGRGVDRVVVAGGDCSTSVSYTHLTSLQYMSAYFLSVKKFVKIFWIVSVYYICINIMFLRIACGYKLCFHAACADVA